MNAVKEHIWRGPKGTTGLRCNVEKIAEDVSGKKNMISKNPSRVKYIGFLKMIIIVEVTNALILL